MLKSIVRLSLILWVAVYSGGPAWAACPKGDLNGDCSIDFQDVAALAEQWLSPPGGPADLDGLNGVETRDFAMLAGKWQQEGIPLVINEVLASNSGGYTDPQGQDDDWIEIYNAGSRAIDTGGMYLTDDLGNPTKWQIPAGNPALTTIPVGGYLLIWADNDPEDYPAGIHAPFELNAEAGDDIGLFDVNGVLIDSVEFPDQTPNISYGRFPDGSDTWQFFGTPTPKTTNTGAYLGQVADTKFSHNRGFYSASFSVTLATETDGAEIYYTTNGTSPFDTAGQFPTGTRYTGPIPINTTTCVRAVAVKVGWKPTNIDAQTYIFLDNVLRQPANPPGCPTNWGHTGTGEYEMDPDVVNSSAYRNTIKDDLKAVPTMSLNMPLDDWFNSSSSVAVGGIYVHPEWEDIYGPEAERAVSVEYFDPASSEQFQINALVRIAGGSSTEPWKMDKLSMRVKFTGRAGEAKLVFPIFGEGPTDQFDTLVLDARMNNSWAYGGGVTVQGTRPWISGTVTQRDIAQYTRDQFVADIHNAMGGYSPHGRHVHLYLNGLYWGLYWVHERPDEHYAEEYFGGEAEDYDVLKHNSATVVNGSSASYSQMFTIANAGLASNEQYQVIHQEYLDVPDFINYMITNYYVGNTDWAHQNWYATRNRVNPDGRWRYHSWDAEHTMEGLTGDSTGKNDSGGPTALHNRLMQNAEYKLLFADHVHRHLSNNGVLTPAGATALYQIRLDDVDRAVVGESARWGDNQRYVPYTRDVDWLAERGWLLATYFPQRTDIVRGQFRSRGWLPAIDPPTFNINGSYKHGGYISSTDSFSITAGAGTIYYTIDGNDPRTPPTWGVSTTLVAENAAKRVLIPTGAISDNWRGGGYFDDSAWRIGNGGVGFETRPGDAINYVALIGTDVLTEMYTKNATCYIRIPFIVNENPAQFNTLRLKMRYDDGFIVYINGTEISPRRNFTGTPTSSSYASASHSDSLAVNFEEIDISSYIYTLLSGANVLAIHGLNRAADNGDFLISTELVAGKGGSAGGAISPSAIQYTGPRTFEWSTCVKARLKNGDTWSALNEATYAVGPVKESLRITEIMYHPQETGDPNDPNEEFIELKNIGSNTINLSLVRFTNGIDFTFPAVELAPAGEPGDHVVAVKDISAFIAAHPGFSGVMRGEYTGSLNNGGERIELQDALGQTIHNFAYKDGWRDITDGQGFSLTIIDPTDTQSSTMPDDGLLAHWRLDDGAGAIAIDSAGINNGTLHGNQGWTTGRIGGALSLDGDGDYVSLSSVGALAGNNVTASVWIYMTALGGALNPVLTQSNSSGDGYYLYTWGGAPAFSLVSGGSTASASSPETIGWNEWHQLAGTNDGSNLRLYVDGVLKGTGSSPGKTGVSENAYIGYASPAYYYGALDDVRIYNRALSESEFAGGSAAPLERWGRKDSWRASARVGGSPGWDDTGIIPNPGAIVISELLAHSHAAAADWIELYNATDQDIDVGGWYLSDTEIKPEKYKFANGTKVRAYDYLVLYEDANFGEASMEDPGKITGFGFSENGDNVCLRSAEGGILTGYREAESFGASYTGVSFGRYFKRSTGSYNFVPMDYNTPGWANAYPEVGPIVINEIMYNPDWPVGGLYANDRYEYIELRNITAEPVTLYRFDKALPWKFTEGIEFVFPAWPSAVTIPAGDHIVVVKDPNVFTWRYPAVPAGKIFGPYTGQLANEGEQVELSMPGDIDKYGRQHYIRIDRVGYSDGSHPEDEPGDVDLWPVEADGGGKSLARKVAGLYGNDPNNWQASIPTPAVVNP